MRLVSNSPVPISTQVSDELRQEILCGSLSPSTRLPSVRALASELKISPGTVKSAYKILIEEGLLQATVLGTWVEEHEKIKRIRRTSVDTHIEIFKQNLVDRGFTQREICESFQRLSVKEA